MSRANLLISLAVVFIVFCIGAYIWVDITVGLVFFIMCTCFWYALVLGTEKPPMLKQKEVVDFSFLDSDNLYTALQLPGCPDPSKVFNYEGMLSVLEDERFQEYLISNISNGNLNVLPVLYGKFPVETEHDGALLYSNLAEAPSLLIAGISGSGKSTLLHSMLSVLLTYNKPSNLELYLCDTKRVELSRYAKFPHVKKIIYNHEDVDSFLNDILVEINERYEYLEGVSITSIQEYNKLNLGEKMRMPFALVVIEELADIMLGSTKETQTKLIRILQKGRAAGVHVITLTQRPSSQIINSSIKANIPNRVALRVSSGTDSRIIIEQTGAEGLLEKGEMFVLNGGRLKYATSIVVTQEEIKKLENAWLAK